MDQRSIGLGLAATALLSMTAGAVSAAEATLCKAGEQVIFSCPVNQKIASVCASGGQLRPDSRFQYRFGAPGAVEMQFPAQAEGGVKAFRFSTVPYSGGGEAHLRFSEGGYDYVVYDTTAAHTPKAGADFDAGVLVLRQGKRVALLRCSPIGEHASIDGPAYDVVPREPYVPYLGP